ncbi:MAG: Na+/H+ antiporter NhaC [Tissierellales bacterium]|jgi:Na+:H+ antiporter, NhaC family|nr:Na+/H+ antiporter NhaC [Tissierellales bacterium]MBN2827392.1 Na+/H+ antiporter NhaC [Tissierellales bacterium]
MKRKATFGEALFPIVSMLILLGVGYGYLQLKAEPLLILASVLAAIIALRVGCTWEEMQEGIVEKIAKAMPASLILLTVGLLIGTWMAAGTIPMMIFYGIQLINPSYIVLTAFMVTALVSTFTGTSWGSVGTVGVAMIGIATGLGVSLPMTAGAIVAGSYFGDKLSPLSDTTNLAPIAAGSELYEHIRHMLYTTVPAFIISLVVYGVLGKNSVSNVANPEKIGIMLGTLDTIYNWHILLIIPVIIVLYGSVAKKPTVPIMLLSSGVAGLIAIIYQGFSINNVFTTMVSGFNVSMAQVEGFDPSAVIWEVTRLVNRGGIMSMMGTLLIAYCAFAFAGIVSKAGLLEVLLEKMQKKINSTGTLILSTVIACITMAVVTGSSYLSIIVPGELFAESYKKMKLHPKNLSRTLEDSGTVVVPLVPWSMAGVYMSSTLGVPVLEYAPWAILCYTGFITAIIYGFTGFGIAKIDEANHENKEHIQ